MVLPNQKQGHHVFYCINKAVSRGDSLVSDLIIALQDYVDAFNIQRSERAGNDGRALCTEVVSIEDDVVSVGIFEALVRFEYSAQCICLNKRRGERAHSISKVRIKIYVIAFFTDVNVNVSLVIE